jgi:hypothetical protein
VTAKPLKTSAYFSQVYSIILHTLQVKHVHLPKVLQLLLLLLLLLPLRASRHHNHKTVVICENVRQDVPRTCCPQHAGEAWARPWPADSCHTAAAGQLPRWHA